MGNDLHADLKKLIVGRLGLDGVNPADIDDDSPLFGEGLGLDSVDALELVVGLELKYGISIYSHDINVNVFSSVSTLAEYIESVQSTTGDGNTRSQGSES